MSKGKMGYEFDGTRLKNIREMLGLPIHAVAEATGLGVSSIVNYERSKTLPGTPALLTFADFYRVPVDYLLGRTDMLGDPSAAFLEARKEAYEKWLIGGRAQIRAANYQPPYPYNLLIAITGEEPEEMLTEDHLNGLEHAISTLSEREQKMIRLYFQEEKSLEDVGREMNVTRERVRQVIAKGERKLRDRNRFAYIEEGFEGCRLKEEENSLELKIRRINELHDELDMLEKALEERKEELSSAEAGNEIKLGHLADNTELDMLELSVRSYNCLNRADLKTLGAICEAAENGELIHVRNLGKKSLIEILRVIEDRTGLSYFHIYNMHEAS